MDAPFTTSENTKGCLNAEPTVGGSEEAQNLISVSVPIDTVPTQTFVHQNGVKEARNMGNISQKPGGSSTPNKGASQVDADEPDDPKDGIHERYNSIFRLERRTLLKRRKEAKKRLVQSLDFFDSIQVRLSYLEDKFNHMIKDPQLIEKNEDSEFDELPPTKGNVVTLDWAKFVTPFVVDGKSLADWKHRAELDHEPKNVIEILIEEPRQDFVHTNSQAQVEDASVVVDESRGSIAATEKTKLQPYQIRIRSKLLLKAMKKITGCQTTGGEYGHRLLLLPPFKLLVEFEKELRAGLRVLQDLYAINIMKADQNEMMKNGTLTNTEGEPLLDYFMKLCSVLDQYLTRQMQLYRGLSPEVSKVLFDDLWYIFKPGYEVRTPGDARIQLYRVLNVTGGRRISRPWNNLPENHASKKLKDHGYSEGSFIIECFYFHFDGTRFGPVNVTFMIRRFEGEKIITSLPVYPIDCDPNKKGIYEKLLARGKTFTEIANEESIAHRKYNSLTLDKTPEQVESEVIIDFKLAFLQNKDCIPNIGLDNLVSDDYREFNDMKELNYPCLYSGCCGNDYIYQDYEVDEKARSSFRGSRKEFFESTEELSPDQIILLPPQAYGFVLRTRRWATFDIDKLEEPDFGSGWADLVIEDDIKKTVLALVENHLRSRDSTVHTNGVLPSVDLVQGKGRGLIILLHGEPGVGKTSTAECVATHTRRPLFPITCSDIGDNAQDVERNLEMNFQLAHKWGCVLLLDEADIFLSARSEQDIQRNAIVSVFLRTLEYYSLRILLGILFLTTNRVGQIDREFKSRIHISLRYEKLDLGRTIRIWENNLKRVKEEFKDQEWTIESEDIIRFAKKHYRKLKKSKELVIWNGRQIRNAFQTAIATAAYEAKQRETVEGKAVKSPRLTSAHFDQVATTAESFDRYLTGLNDGYTDPDLAKQDRLRYDDFREPKKSKRDKEKHKQQKKSDRRRYQSDSDESSDEESSKSEESEESQESEKETEQSGTSLPASKRRKRS